MFDQYNSSNSPNVFCLSLRRFFGRTMRLFGLQKPIVFPKNLVTITPVTRFYTCTQECLQALPLRRERQYYSPDQAVLS